MIKIKYKLFFLILFLCCSITYSMPPRKSGNGTRINFGPVIGFYSINSKHAKNPTQKSSAIFGFRREVRADRSFNTFFLFGIDYFFHGLNFKSYYFQPDTIQIYDKSFAYNYSLFIHEIDLPLQVKFLLKREDNALFSPYIAIAYHLRYLLPAQLKVDLDGNQVKNDSPDLVFKTPLINDHFNAFVSLSLGWQKNSLTQSRGSFFGEINYRYGFSAYYFASNYAATSLYINGSHLSIQVGLKF